MLQGSRAPGQSLVLSAAVALDTLHVRLSFGHSSEAGLANTCHVCVDLPFCVQVGERFKCLSYTLEMPFKDTQDHPDNVHGWSVDRAKHFGAAILQPIYEVVPKLRQPVEKEKGVTVVHA